ncbi:nucleotide exchange factor GrpE [Candidatus Saccharibacteria bacterium]|nr:nucleotide exchange factor GrpE [Candidatus Saccharibacteria bacterium]
MAKKDDTSSQDVEQTQESTTEVHVETSSEQHVDGGEVVDERIDELTGDLKRVQAEFVNFRRRADEEKTEMMRYATGRIAREFLTVRDSFDAELKHRPAGVDAKWAASIDSIRAQFDKTMTTLGVERFESTGHAFDPHRHEAIAMEEGTGDHEVVTEELQPGYSLGEQVLRHAIVKVGKTDTAPAEN